jgi:quinol monooxygenase YgiN
VTAVVVVATIRPLPEHRAEMIAAFEKAIAAVHADDAGCLLYALHKGPCDAPGLGAVLR